MSGYSEEAQLRISGLGTNVIAAFLDEIPYAHREKIYSPLKPIDGFRKDSKPELKARIKKLVLSISHAAEQKAKIPVKEWVVFERAWILWSMGTFGPHIPKVGEFSESTEEDALAYVKQLVVLNEDNGCAREDIEKLMLFSGFPSSVKIQNIIAGIPKRDELEKTQRIKKIPEELENLRREIAVLSKDVKKYDAQGGALSIQIEEIRQQRIGDSKIVSQALIDIDSTEKIAFEFSEKVRQLNLMLQEIGEEQNVVKDDLKKINVRDSTMVEINQRLVALEASFDSIQTNQVLPSSVGVESPQNNSLDNFFKTEINQFSRCSGLVDIDEGIQLISIKDTSSALAILSNNFASVGLSKSESDQISPVVFAAFAAGQLVQFSGSLGDILADAACRALGDKRIFEWRVPLGICDSEDCVALLAILSSNEAPKSIVIRGANKSAFEIYGQELKVAIAKHQLAGRESRKLPLLVATLIGGPAAFNESISLMEVGPQIDSDKLKWGTSKLGQLKYGQLKDGFWESVGQQKLNIDDCDECQRICKEFKLPTNQLWNKLLLRASEELFRIPESTFELSMQRILNHWVIPSAQFHKKINGEFHGVLKKELRSIIDKLDIEIDAGALGAS